MGRSKMSNYNRPQSAAVRSQVVTPKVGAARPMSAANRTLHDRETYLKLKTELSAPFFVKDKVQTCSHIMRKNGKSVAVAFPLEKTGWKAPNSYNNQKRSAETKSWARHTYKQQVYDHLGMNKKRLEPYNPLAKRSQLPKPSVVMPYKNSSQIVIGDRASYKPKHFEATNRMFLQAPDLHEATTNPGILARRTLWTHRHQDLK